MQTTDIGPLVESLRMGGVTWIGKVTFGLQKSAPKNFVNLESRRNIGQGGLFSMCVIVTDINSSPGKGRM